MLIRIVDGNKEVSWNCTARHRDGSIMNLEGTNDIERGSVEIIKCMEGIGYVYVGKGDSLR